MYNCICKFMLCNIILSLFLNRIDEWMSRAILNTTIYVKYNFKCRDNFKYGSIVNTFAFSLTQKLLWNIYLDGSQLVVMALWAKHVYNQVLICKYAQIKQFGDYLSYFYIHPLIYWMCKRKAVPLLNNVLYIC